MIILKINKSNNFIIINYIIIKKKKLEIRYLKKNFVASFKDPK